MKRLLTWTTCAILLAILAANPGLAADATARAQAKAKSLAWLSTDPTVVAAVKQHNATPPAEAASMTNEKWKGLTVLDPFVRSLSKNALATYLKGKKEDAVSELFVSGADGTKVAFFAKTSSWTHKGKSKHEMPMKGETWVGPVGVDQSTGVEQIQVGLPVLDGGKPIGSVVVGLDVKKLQ